MSVIYTEVKATPTTTPSNTHVEVPHTLKDGVLLYRPDANAFIALYPDEWLLCRYEGHENKTAIEELQEANRDVTEKSLLLQYLLQQPNSAKAEIVQAKKWLDEALDSLSQKSDAAKKRVEAITSQKIDSKKLVELVPLTMMRIEGKTNTPIYVSELRLQAASADRRIYVVEGSAERQKHPEEKLINGTKLNTDQLRKGISDQVQDKAKFERKWKLAPKDADQYSGILTDWAKVMGPSVTEFLERTQQEVIDGIFSAYKRDPKNPYRIVDLKPEAQFMRWSAGAGAEATFMPFQGSLYDARDTNWGQRFKRAAKTAQFGIKANAEASFAVAEAKVETILYLPHAAGWHLDATMIGQPLDFGYFRLRGGITLYGLAGASVAIEASAALMITGDKQGITGIPRKRASADAKIGAKGEAKLFAGAKGGIDLVGALQWLNPEGFIDPKSPKKADASKAIAAYVDVASLSGGVAVIAGLAAALGFECDYREGNFVIAANAGACLGLGGSGSFAFKVASEQISQFFMCIAHQLKQADYKKMSGLMKKSAFDTVNRILYLIVASNRTLESFIGSETDVITQAYGDLVGSIRQSGAQAIKQIEQRLKAGWGWYAYMPPESRGAVVASIVEVLNQPRYSGDYSLREAAAFSINELMATTQSVRHLDNTLDRITVAIGEELGRNHGVQLINSALGGTLFAGCINRCEDQLAKASALIGRPFLRNDAPDFQLAQFPLHHPGYNVA